MKKDMIDELCDKVESHRKKYGNPFETDPAFRADPKPRFGFNDKVFVIVCQHINGKLEINETRRATVLSFRLGIF